MDGSSHIDNGASFFRNVSCPYFPCHEGVEPEEFNCLFCYCPLYALGPCCGGDFYYTATGIKDCSACVRLHRGEQGVGLVKRHFAQLADLAKMPAPHEGERPALAEDAS